MSIKKILYRSFSTKPVIVMIHGYSERRAVPIQNAVDFFKLRGYHVLVPILYDHSNPKDHVATDWIDKARESVKEAFSIKDDVVVLGFSMGGVIASQVASEFPVSSLILIAPAFEYVTFKAVKNKITSYVIKKQDPLVNTGTYVPLPESFMDTFQEVVNLCKHSISKVTCPLLLVHGTSDMTIPIRASEYAYVRCPSSHKKMYRLENVGHNVLENKDYKEDVLCIIESNIKK